MMIKKPPIKPLNKFIRLSGSGVQMGVTIYLAAYFGKKMDAYFGYHNAITLSLVLVAFIVSIYSLLQQLKKIQEKE